MKFSKRRNFLAASCLGLWLFAAAGAHAAFPDKPVRIVVPFPAGGAVDLVARIVANHLSRTWGTAVVVDNKAGAGGAIGVDAVAKAAPTGYELLLGPIGPLTINPSLYPKLPYDTERDFAPVVLIAGTPAVVVVQPSSNVRSVRELVDTLKAQPGKMSYGSAGNGNLTHLVTEYFLRQVGARATHIPYKGSAPAVSDFLGGQLDMMFDVVPTALPHIRSGKFRALAVTSRNRSSSLPDVPTLDEEGFKGFNVTSWWGLLAPKGTPQEVINALNVEINKGLKTPAVQESLLKLGADPLGGTPEQFKQHIHAELVRWKQVVIESGAKVD